METDIPQTWNRYSYVLNAPLISVDPTGLFEWGAKLGGEATDTELRDNANAIKDEKQRKKALKRAEKIIGRRDQIRTAMEAARTAALQSTSLTQEQKKSIVNALDAYGSEHDGNNVRLSFGENTGGLTSLNRKTGIIDVTFRPGQSERRLAGNISHEGQHVADYNEYWNNGSPIASLDRTSYERETRAYTISSYMAQAMNMSAYNLDVAERPSELIWQSSWLKLDKKQMESKRSDGIRKFVANQALLSEPNNLGPRISEEKDL